MWLSAKSLQFEMSLLPLGMLGLLWWRWPFSFAFGIVAIPLLILCFVASSLFIQQAHSYASVILACFPELLLFTVA
jgi:hypothetical protein